MQADIKWYYALRLYPLEKLLLIVTFIAWQSCTCVVEMYLCGRDVTLPHTSTGGG